MSLRGGRGGGWGGGGGSSGIEHFLELKQVRAKKKKSINFKKKIYIYIKNICLLKKY